jgi:HAD superfamily hydrolase (TIGR01549 family)
MTSLAEAIKQAPIKALLFDLDDTLYDSKPIYALGLDRAWSVFHQSNLGKGVDRNKFNELYAAARNKTKSSLAHSPSKNSRLIYFHHLVVALHGAPLAKLAFELDKAYESAYETIDFSEARAVIRKLKTNFKIAIITNQTLQAQFAKLANLDPAGELIDLMVTSESVGFEKPEPKVFQVGLEELNISPGEALMIGDNHDHDISGARALGIHCLHLTNSSSDAPLLEAKNPILGRVGCLQQVSELLLP